MNSAHDATTLGNSSAAHPVGAPGRRPAARTLDGSTLVVGQPWSGWDHLVDACTASMPSAVVVLGDLGTELPPGDVLNPLRDAGVEVRWVLTSHGGDRFTTILTRPWATPDLNLSGRVREWGGLSVAALGGCFRQRVWWPKSDADAVATVTRSDLISALLEGDRWRFGVPPGLRETIFPENVAAFEHARADVLITSEAPTGHRYGFAAIDRAAAMLGARLVIHGARLDRHERWSLPGGVQVRGVLMGEVIRLRRDELP